MAYTIWEWKVWCDTCNTNTGSCPVSTSIPQPLDGLNGYQYNWYNVDRNGTTIQSINIIQWDFHPTQYLDILNSGAPMPLFKKFQSKYKALSRLLFDLDSLYDESNYGNKLGSTSIAPFKTFANAPVLPSTDGTSFIFFEESYEKVEAYVLEDAANSNQIVLHDWYGNPVNPDDPKYRWEYEVGKTLYIVSNGSSLWWAQDDNWEWADCCAATYQRVIVDMDTVEINGKTYWRLTLEQQTDSAGNPIQLSFKWMNWFGSNADIPNLNDDFGNVYKWDRVVSLYKTRNDCDPITWEANEQWMTSKVSYIQHFGKKITFKKFELNVSYANKDWAMWVVGRKVWNVTRKMVEEMAYTFYLWQNRSPNSNVTYVDPLDWKTKKVWPETMWILPQLRYYAATKPELWLITSMKKLRTPEAKASLIVDQINKVQQSWAVSQWDEIVMLMDSKAFSTYMKLNNAFTKLMWWTFQITQNVKKEFVVPEIWTPYWTVSIYTCPVFEHITGNTWNILFIPKKLVMITQRQNQAYNAESGSIEKASLWFKTMNVTLPGVKGHECETYDVYTEFAIILWLVDSWAYRWIQNCS